MPLESGQPLVTWVIRTMDDSECDEAGKLVHELTSQAVAALLMKRGLGRPPIEAIATPTFLVTVTGEELRNVPPFGTGYAFVYAIDSPMADHVRMRLRQIGEEPSAVLKRRGTAPLNDETRIVRYDPAHYLNN
jgi:hypothetical protein